MPRESMYTALEQAVWMKVHLSEMSFTLNPQYDTVATVWIADDPEGDKVLRMGMILETLFGAYLSGPSSNYPLPGRPVHQSFGFYNDDLLAHARRVFPLPDGLRSGKPIYLTGLTEEGWRMVERAYNKRPKDFFPYGGTTHE